MTNEEKKRLRGEIGNLDRKRERKLVGARRQAAEQDLSGISTEKEIELLEEIRRLEQLIEKKRRELQES